MHSQRMMESWRDEELAKKKICVGKKFLCNNYLQCEDGKDEEDCEQQYKTKSIK